MRAESLLWALTTPFLLGGSASAIDLDIKNEQSIKDAAAISVFNAMSCYNGNETGHIPGAFPEKWWEGSILFSTMIQYWSLTGDDSNNAAVSQGMYWQRGEKDDYMPSNYSSYLGNDDQLFWGLAAMTAAELGFPQNPSMPTWVTLAENVFNDMVARWDTSMCGGGLRWQLYVYQSGYTIKNSITNGAFFELSARLGRYTKNQSYAGWAEHIWDWSTKVSLVDQKTWRVADATNGMNNCVNTLGVKWSENYDTYMTGVAYMYNLTDGKSKWKSSLDGIFNSSRRIFFPMKSGTRVMSEITCEAREICNNNEILFKGIFAQDLAMISSLAPYTASEILPLLQSSAIGAANSCTGGESKNRCGVRWYGGWDGWTGMEEDISAASLFTSNLVAFKHESIAAESIGLNGTGTSSTSGSSASGTGSGAAAVSTAGANDASSLSSGFLGMVATATMIARIFALL